MLSLSAEWQFHSSVIVRVVGVTGIHRTMENAKIRSLRMDTRVWTQPLIQVLLLVALTSVARYDC